VSYKVSHYFQCFEGREDEPAVAMHGRTGGIYTFGKSVLPALKEILAQPDASPRGELFDFLVREEVLVDSNTDELDEIKALHRAGRASKHELYVTYSMTNACNFRCTYCYQEHKKQVLAGDALEKTYRYIERELAEYESLRVHWFGGEPLLRLKSVLNSSAALIEICRKMQKPYSAAVTTNGSLFTAETARSLKAVGVEQVAFTLDGARPVHDATRLRKNGSGSYEAVMQAMRIAVDEGYSVFVRVNLNKKAEASFADLLDDIRRRGLGPDQIGIYIAEMKQHSNSMALGGLYYLSVAEYAQSFIDALKVMKEFGYPMPKLSPLEVNCSFDKPSSVLFGVDGNLYHCTTGTDRALGELDESGAIVHEDARRRRIHSREPWDDPHCATCKSLPTCMGGCAHLDEEGKTKCNPEGFVIEQLLRLNLPT